MKKPPLIDRLIFKYTNKEQQLNFLAKDLYAGEIVFYKKSIYKGVPYEQGTPRIKPVRKFAILTKEDDVTYKHAKTQQALKTLDWADRKYDYVVRKVKPLTVRLAGNYLFGDIDENRVLSLGDIECLEKRVNTLSFPEQKKSFFFD